MEVQRPCLLEEGEVHDHMAACGHGVELASAEERLGEAVRERRYRCAGNRWPCCARARRQDGGGEQRGQSEAE
jgi:hypothetical protein